MAPTMPQSVVGMQPQNLPGPLQPIPNARPMPPTNLPGGMPPSPGLPQMARPGSPPPALIGVDQGNGTVALHYTNPNGAIGPVYKVIPAPKNPGAGQIPPPPAPVMPSGIQG